MKKYTDDIRVLKDNGVYNFGDVMYGRGPWRASRSELRENPLYEETILGSYFRKSTCRKKYAFDKSLFNSIFDELDLRAKYSFQKDSLYIHLRAGDIVPKIFLPSPTPLEKRVKHRFNQLNILHPLSIAAKAESHKTCCDSVVFATAYHYSYDTWAYSETSHHENNYHFDSFCREFKNHCPLPFSVLPPVLELSDIQFVDYTFYILCKSSHAILDNGGFSEVISEYRRD